MPLLAGLPIAVGGASIATPPARTLYELEEWLAALLDTEDIAMAQVAHHTSGKEMPLAVLFSDVRDFTPFAESHLPYDVVHVLNRYFRKWGEAVLGNHGYLDKYIGDGLMALFGLCGCGLPEACGRAVRAALGCGVVCGLALYLGGWKGGGTGRTSPC